jgi:hypothetical protein
MGVAGVAAFASILPDRSGGEPRELALVGALWFVAFVGGAVGSLWTSGNSRRPLVWIGVSLGISNARTASELMAQSDGYAAALAGFASAAASGAIVWLFVVIGRMNPDPPRKEVVWKRTADPDLPYEAQVDGERWQVRVNRGEGAPPYTLLVDDAPALDLDDWPAAWTATGVYAG